MKIIYKQIKADDADMAVGEEDGVITGYGSIFGNKDLGGDIVVKGAFTKSLKSGRSIKMFWGHEMRSVPIGIWTSAKEDEKGLLLEGKIFTDTDRGREVYVAMKNGAVDGLSIGYEVVKGRETKSGMELIELRLHEVSIVNFPMNAKATVESVKSAKTVAEKKNLIESALRDAGFSAKQAKHGASVLVREVLGERDATNTTAEMAANLKRFVRDLRT